MFLYQSKNGIKMSKNLSHLASSLRSNNPTAIMLINAIIHEDVGFVRQTTKSDLSKEQKLNIIGSVKVQSYKDQEVKIDNNALFKLAAENLSDDGIKIKFLICNFIIQAHCSRFCEQNFKDRYFRRCF